MQILYSAEPDIETILRKYEAGLQTIRSARIVAFQESSDYSEQSCFVFQDGNSHLRKSSPVPQNDFSKITEMLYKDHTLLMVTETADKSGKSHALFLDGLHSDYTANQNVYLDFTCLFGELPFELLGEKSILKVLRTYISSINEVSSDENAVFEMQGNRDGVSVTAHFVVQNDYAILKGLRYHVDDNVAQGGTCYAFDYCPDDFVQHGNLWIPQTYQYDYSILTMNYEYDNNMQLVQGGTTKNPAKRHCERIQKLEINPKISESFFCISFDIPNGTPVADRRAPQIEYVWFNGKVVAKTDEIALAIARGDYGFMPGPKNPRFWLMALGLGLLLLGGGLKIRSMLKSA